MSKQSNDHEKNEKHGIVYFEKSKHHSVVMEFPKGTKQTEIIETISKLHPQWKFKDSHKICDSFNESKLKKRVKWFNNHYATVIKPRQKKH